MKLSHAALLALAALATATPLPAPKDNGAKTCSGKGNGAFCDSAGVCQDGTGASYSGRFPDCAKTNAAETCTDKGGFCDSAGVCQDGTGANFSGSFPDCAKAKANTKANKAPGKPKANTTTRPAKCANGKGTCDSAGKCNDRSGATISGNTECPKPGSTG